MEHAMHFDNSITLGNLVTLLTALFAIWRFWAAQVASKRDLEWRIGNLETWQAKQQKADEERDGIIRRMDKILFYLTEGKLK